MKYALRSLCTTILIVVSFGLLGTASNEMPSAFRVSESFLIDSVYNSKYREIIDYIKSHEGLCRTPYKCPAGYLTIGYGHLIQSNESFTELDEFESEELLRSDLNKSIELAKKYSPKCNKIQHLAIGHFIYSLGCGTYHRSSLRKLIDSGQSTRLIGEEFVKYCNYVTPNGTVVRSELAYRLRQTEFDMFSLGDSIQGIYHRRIKLVEL